MSADFPYLVPAVATKRKRPGLRLLVLFLAVALGTCGALALGEKIRQAREACRERLPLESLFDSGMGRTRPLPARLSGFGYGKYRSVERDSEADWKTWKRRVKQGTEAGKRGGQQLRVEALLALLEKEEADSLRPALLRMETAVADPDAPASAWSDLAAIRYSTARLWNEPYLFLDALETAEQALDRNASLPEALFNRALCLEALGLWRHALETWDAYLRVDSSSDWVAEARTHRAEIAENRLPDPEGWPKGELKTAALSGDQAKILEIVRDYRSPSRRLLEEEILSDWGKARLDFAPNADSHLRAAKNVANAYQALAGDSLYREAVEVLDQTARNAADPRGILELAEAHRDFAQAVEAIDELEDIEKARILLEKALPLFQRHASPFTWRTELKLAIVEQRSSEFAPALRRLTRLREQIRQRSYPNLLGESFYIEGTNSGIQGDLDSDIDPFQKALELFETAGEIDNRAGVLFMQAELRDLRGERRKAWKLLSKPLTSTAEIYMSRRLYQVYAAAATSAWTASYPRVGLLFWEELEPWTRSNPKYPVETRLWQARLLHGMGKNAEAKARLDEAREKLPAVTSTDSRTDLEIELRGVEGELAIVRRSTAAVDDLKATLDYYREKKKHVWEKTVLLRLAHAYRALDQEEEARRTLRESWNLTDKQRLVLSEEERASLYQAEAAAFEELIELEFDAGHPELAFYYNERRLARSLLDRFTGKISRFTPGKEDAVGSIQEITRQLPPDLTLIEYALVKKRWLAWVISSKGVRGLELPEASSLATQASRWVGNIQRRTPPDKLKADGSALYRRLIAPLGPLEGDWVIIPDGPLKDLPFAALFDGQRLVVEKRAVSYSPSAKFFVAARRQDRGLGSTSPLQALVIGNPAFENKEPRWLTPLPESEHEAGQVAKHYGVEPLLGGLATKARFLSGIQGSELVHFSGHAVTHPESPQESALILADGSLTARGIQARKLPSTRLVVLGACSTASGPSLGGEGAESLARAFQAAGVPGVVASLWDVSDFSTSELMIKFHRQLLATKDARQALRQAQLWMLKSNDPRHHDPAAWAAFQLIGEATFRGSRP